MNTHLLQTLAVSIALLSLVSQCAAVPAVVQPTHKDVSYGPHERMKLNFWKVESDKPVGVLVHIHGGGWIGGKKRETLTRHDIVHGYSVCSINYRLSGTAILPAPVHDAARAIQFLRTKAKDWNIHPDKIVVQGGSAGAATSLWLAFHDDLADADSTDPVLRQSSRVAGAVGMGGQTTLDPHLILKRIGSAGAGHPMIWKSVGARSLDDLLKNWDKYKALSHEFSVLRHVTKDDPPVYVKYGAFAPVPVETGKGDGIHHAAFGVMLKEKCDKAGTRCILQYAGGKKPAISSNEFVKRILTK